MNYRSMMNAVALLAVSGLALPSVAVAQPGDAPAKKDTTTAPLKVVKPTEQPKKDEKKKDDKKDEKKKDEPTLKVGSAAPAITATKWVKGKEVKSFEKGKVYVVEFWATWCGPCIENIPHMTELAKAHKDVTFIGMASSERKKGEKDERLAGVEKFVKDQGDKMDYTVAYDADRKMSEGWMKPAGQGGIPCAFIVDGEGKIAFVGHPADGEFAKTIEKLDKKSEKKDEKHKDKDKTKDKEKDKSKDGEKKK